MATKKTYPDVPQYVSAIVMDYEAVSADESTDKHVFDMPRAVTGAIAQIRAATTGAANATGLAVKVIEETSSAPCKVEVAVTALVEGDVISLIAW